jgi:chromosomal replication initiation ATPase DnaA
VNTVRPIEEIVAEKLNFHGVSLVELRGARQSMRLRQVRREALEAVWLERPDLSSGQVAKYFNREGSTVRHMVRNVGVAA